MSVGRERAPEAVAFPLRFGIGTGNRRPFAELARQWQLIEQLGFDSAWVVDHFFGSDDELVPYYEAWTLISALGALTNRIRVGVVVSGNTYRNPGLLAKEAVTIDHVTNGRLDLGIGAGWMESEHRAYSYDFPSVRERLEMLEESLQILDGLMTRERTTFRGKHYQFENAPFQPKPLQKPRIPIVVGAFKPKVIGLAARYADILNTRGTPDEVRAVAEQAWDACRASGRDPSGLRLSVFTWQHPFTSVEEFRATSLAYLRAGYTDLLFPMPPSEQVPVLERCAREVMPELRRLQASGALAE